MNISVKQYTLLKLLGFIKFDCEDPECREFAASPIIGRIYSELLEELNQKEIKIPLELNKESRRYDSVIDGIKRNLEWTHEWENMPEELKTAQIIALASPFILDEADLQALYNFREIISNKI